MIGNAYSIVTTDDPYAAVIKAFIAKEFPMRDAPDKCLLLESVASEILSTGSIRNGPMPSVESQAEIRNVVRKYLLDSRPIPFVVAWGSEKPNGTGIDIAELMAIRTLVNLNERIARHYSPGAVFHIKIEDVSAPFMFFDRADAARKEAALYTNGFMKLMDVLSVRSIVVPVPESSLKTEAEFNAAADSILPLMERHVSMNPDVVEPELAALGWTRPLSQEAVTWWLERYKAKFYPDKTDAERKHLLARDYASILARRYLGMRFTSPTWVHGNLELSFHPIEQFMDAGRTLRRVHYRTMPSNLTSNHIAPWRAKGFVRVSSQGVKACLSTFRDGQDYNQHSIILRGENGMEQEVAADYCIED